MSTETPDPVEPIATIEDPRAITLLTTEHWSLLSARSLAYNEAFVRAGMFLTFLSASFVALALVAQAMSFERDFVTVAAVVLAFDFVVGLASFGRINGANLDDLRANHGMARIRHAYTQITPLVAPYFTTPTHDDLDTVTTVYGPISDRMVGQFVYALTTSSGMIGLIVSMVGGVLTALVATLLGLDGGAALWIGVGSGVVIFLALFTFTALAIQRAYGHFTSLFPSPKPETVEPSVDQP